MTLRLATLINDFAGGTAGQTVSPSNSGPPSGQAFDTSLATTGAGTCAYDTTYLPPGGTMACKVATTGAGSAYIGWTTSLTSPNGGAQLAQAWFRAYLYVPAALPVNTTVFGAFQAGGGTCGTVKLTTAGTVTFSDNTGTVQVTTAAFPLSQWFRLEGFIAGDPSAGQLNLVLYSSADSTTASSAPPTATGLNTLGTMTGWRFGQATSLAGAGPYWMGNPGLSNAGPIGPTPLGFTGIREDGAGAITGVAVSVPGIAPPAAPAGTPGLCGSTTITGLYPATATRSASAAAFDSAAGEPMAAQCQKLYFPNSFPTAIVDGSGNSVSALAAAGCRFWLCYAPAVNGSDMTAFTGALQAWVNAGFGAQVKVVIYQEPQNASWGLTSATFIQAVRAYAAMVHGFGMKIIYDAAGHAQNQWLSWYPADATASFTAAHASPAVFTSSAPVSDGAPVVLSGASLPGGFTAGTVYYAVGVSGSTFNLASTYNGTGLPSGSSGSGTIAVRYADEIAVDYYGNDWVNQGGPAAPDQLKSLYTQANADNKPFGIGEIGSAIQPSLITNANFATAAGTQGGFPLNYMGYLQTLFTSRLSQGLANSDVMWYSGDKNGPCPNTLSGPATTVGANSSGGQISQIATSTWTSTTAGGLAPGVLAVASTANFGTGLSAGNLYVQCANGTVAVINYNGISGNTFTGCTYTSGSPSGTVSTGAFLACWAFANGVTTDFRVPYVQSLYAAITSPAPAPSAVSLTAAGDVEGFFTSSDQGNHWQVSNTGVYGLNWRRCAGAQYAVTGEGTSVIYACTGLNGSGGGFLASANGGATWSMRSTQVQFSGNTSNYPAGVPADQARPAGNVLAQVAGQDLMYAADYKAGVFRAKGTAGSPNYGHAWVNIGIAGGTHYGRSVAVDPSNSANVFVSMFAEGVYNATNAATAATANWALQASSPNFAEQLVVLTSGNVYVAGGSGAGGGLWTTPASGTGSGTWSQVGGALTATSALSSSSYWMSLDGYTDASGNDQLIIGCNSPVKGPGGACRTLMWVTVPPSGSPAFTDASDVAASIQIATVPPDSGRTWWHTDTSVPNPSQATGYAEWLGGAAYFQPHPTIDKSTINTASVTVYCAGASGVFATTGNTVGATGIFATPGNAGPQPPSWNLAINGLAAYPAHQVVLDPGNPLHLAWATRDWGATEISDGNGYNAATLTQWTPPRPGGISIGGFATAIDPVTSAVFLSSGTKGGSNTNGQIYSRNNAFATSNVSAAGTGGAPYATTTFNPGGNVAYGLYAGRDGSGSPYLLALIQGAAGTGGMYRFSGHAISAAGNVTGGTWSLQGSAPIGAGAALGTAGGAANEPNGPQGPIVADPGNAGVLYCFDQNTGLWRNSGYGAGTWTQIWAVVANDARTGFIAANPAVAGELWLSYWTSGAVPGGLFKISGANTITQVILTGGSLNTVQVAGIAMPGSMCFAPNGDVYCLSLPGPAPLAPGTQLMGSQNGGATWFPADSGSVAAFASYPTNMVMTGAGRIYIANNANIIAYGYPAVPAQAPSASMAAVAALAATAVDASGGVIPVSTSLAAIVSLSASIGSAGRAASAGLAAVVSLSGSLTGSPFIVQAISGTSAFDYGLSSVEMTTAAGNTLVVLAGWDLSTGPTTAPMPAVYVSDSAGNYWIHVTTTTPGVTGARCSAWICPNAMSIDWLSVSLTAFASSLAYTVLELTGMPSLYSLDCYDITGAQSASSLMLNPGSAGDDDFAFALFATGALTGAGPGTPPGWQALQSVTAGPGSAPGITPPGLPPPGFGTGYVHSGGVPQLPGNVNPVTIWPYFQIAEEGAPLGMTLTLDQAVPAAALVFAVRTTVYPPLQQNPGMPVIKVEAGFGAVPGDTSQAPPQWTDITDRVIAPDGGTWVKTASGRQYELAQAEAGTVEIWVNNADGALTPGNANSIYAPGTGVMLGTPVRVSAYWAGQWYAVAYGWVERWPQEWPDLPQWGISKMIATDAISVLAAVTMASALESDILADAPYLLLPAAEQYLSFSNGTTGAGTVASAAGPFVLGSYQTADAQGLTAQNYSRSNQRPGMYVDGNDAGTGGNGPAIAATGQTTNLLGSSNTGFGTDAITTAPASPSCGPGIIYTDPGIPDPSSGSGVTVSFWLAVAPQAVAASVQPTVFSAYGPPSNYRTRPSLSVQVLNFNGANLLQVTLADGTAITVPFTPGTTAQLVTLILAPASMNVYVNGALEAAASLTAAQTTQWLACSLGCPNYAYGTTGVVSGSFTAWDLAVYAYPLPPQRSVAQYATGLFGQQNVDATTRAAQLLAWAGIGLPRGGRQTFNGIQTGITQGPAYNLAGSTCSDQVNQVAVSDQGMIAAMPGGALTVIHRQALFNQSPVAVFGDNPDPSQGQVPFAAGQSWGYDNTYLYNIASVTQQYGPNNLFTVTGADFTSQSEYFARSAIAQTISTMSNLDAANLMSWLIAKYGQPSLRVSTVTIDAASNPQAAFPAILPLLQGQVATVTRTPVGGAQITQTCLTQRIAHAIGPNQWAAALQLSPFTLESAILTLDEPGFDVAGSTALA